MNCTESPSRPIAQKSSNTLRTKARPDCDKQSYSQRCGELLFVILIRVRVAVKLVFILFFLKNEKHFSQPVLTARLLR